MSLFAPLATYIVRGLLTKKPPEYIAQKRVLLVNTNDWVQLFDDRIHQLNQVLDRHRDASPLAVAKLEELLRDVQRIRDEIFPPEA